MAPTDFMRLFEYDAWATRSTLAGLDALTPPDLRSQQILSHLLMAQKVWLNRIEGRDTSPLTIWPDLTPDERRALLEENQRGYRAFLAGAAEGRLGKMVRYRTSKGAELQTAIADILTQVLFHGAYHRGQLAVAIRRQGGQPPETDYIHFARQA